MRVLHFSLLGRRALVVALGIALSGCRANINHNPLHNLRLVGAWKGGAVTNCAVRAEDLQVRQISLRPDSSLALSAIYELGPRSRLWRFDIPITYHGNEISWLAHQGGVSANGDTMRVTKRWKGEVSEWVFVRNRTADIFMDQLLNSDEHGETYHPPPDLHDQWPCAGLAECGLDQAPIITLLNRIRAGELDDIHSVLLVKDGKLVVEEYFAANGSRHGPFVTEVFRRRVHHLASTTKGVTSALVGIAIDQGFIKSVQDPIVWYLPSYGGAFDEQKRGIRIRDMLTMTPGLAWKQFGVDDAWNDGMRMWHTDDVIRFVLEKPMVDEPGVEFNYSNGTPTVTGAILRNAVGMDVAEFAKAYLFGPLGIADYSWTSYPDGSIETDGGLALHPRGLAKIGQLFLDGGVWNGKRIVSEQWVRESTSERLRFGKSNRWGYGYHWMQMEMRIGNAVVHSYFVPGDGNQILAVFPELESVVVFTAGNYGRDPKTEYHSLFTKFILPSVKFNE